MKSLFDEVRSEQNIFSAWRHVKKSALTSKDGKIRGEAAEFEHTHQRHLKRIISQLRTGTFSFDAAEGILKDKRKRLAQNKDPRPIVIGSIKNRIVQRAILQVLQPRIILDLNSDDPKYETKSDTRLGKINNVNRSKFGVGGLLHPYGGVKPAIATIRASIDTGAKYYFQSDIQGFFTQIPIQPVVDFVLEQTRDEKLTDLFQRGLEVHLKNTEEVFGYQHLFPSNGIGVAQGSSLSAFAGNVLLFDLDHKLNSMNVTAIRYIDDILMVSDDLNALEEAISFAKTNLEDFKFKLYTPVQGSDKASRGECSDAFNFLGCTIQPKKCSPSKASTENLKKSITDSLDDSARDIYSYVRGKANLNPKHSYSAVIQTIGKKIYGWQKSFSFCNQIEQFRNIDFFTSQKIDEYNSKVRRMLAKANKEQKMVVYGIPSMATMFQNKK